MGGQACKLKEILNSGGVIDGTARLLNVIEEYGVPDEGAEYKIIEQLNTAEDAVNNATRIFLEAHGFNGPWPKSLS